MSETMTVTANDAQGIKEPQQQQQISAEDHEQMVRSGVTAAIIGFFCGGPLLSALLGFAAAHASQKKGKEGEYARSIGDFGVSVREKAAVLDEKHQIAERTTNVANQAWEKAKQYDGKYDLLDKARDTTVACWLLLVKYVHEYHLLERGVEVTGKGYEYVADKIGASSSSEEALKKQE